jgi:hypothetical protein
MMKISLEGSTSAEGIVNEQSGTISTPSKV